MCQVPEDNKLSLGPDLLEDFFKRSQHTQAHPIM
uniref:Uncharacterized protein n=1 Tax=Anguilla anguilla TaxID=7936 RepID=A0A0E9SLR9_ANGAN